MRIIDISMEISRDMPVYKGRDSKRPHFKQDSNFNTGTVYETRIDMNLHTGTHADAPLHIIEGGDTMSGLPLDRFVRKCVVLDMTAFDGRISRIDLLKKLGHPKESGACGLSHLNVEAVNEGDREACGYGSKIDVRDMFVLLKTRNSLQDILEGPFVYVDASGAELLREAGVSGVGVDGLGIERDQPGHETHITLMEAGIVILEGLRLADVEEGEYLLVAPPLNIPGAEAAPARAMLIQGLKLP
ncbi:MAG: cyclase family protein [Clostridiales bacterium]|nr:cyclase family protein [Clostridiales bacterium]